MRITSNAIYSQFSSNLRSIQERQARDNIRVYTGKNMVDLADDPSAVNDIQYFTENINRNNNYIKNIDSTLDEQLSTEGALENIANTLDEVRSTGIQAMEVGNQDKLPVLGESVKKLLTSMVNTANNQYNGAYTLAGTKTTAQALTPTAPEITKLPFELVLDTPTSSNPSGLRVTFKGNFSSRNINVGPNASEEVNSTADDAFGTGGVEAFNNVIKLYNTLTYKPDGTLRSTGDKAGLTKNERDAISDEIVGINNSMELVNQETGRMGARQARLQNLRDLMNEDNSRMKEFRSQKEDTDVAQAIMEMQKDETALQYSLKVGSKLMSQSLLDFLG